MQQGLTVPGTALGWGGKEEEPVGTGREKALKLKCAKGDDVVHLVAHD